MTSDETIAVDAQIVRILVRAGVLEKCTHCLGVHLAEDLDLSSIKKRVPPQMSLSALAETIVKDRR